MKPAIDKFETGLDPEEVVIERINIDDSPELASQYKIQSVPTFIFVKDSLTVDTLVGVQSIKTFDQIIERWS